MKISFMGEARVAKHLLAAAACALLAGCGAAEGPKLLKTGGVVKYKGNVVKGASVSFIYDSGDVAVGTTNDEGRFSVTTNGREGAPVGKSKVVISKVSGGGLQKPAEELRAEDMMKMYSQQGGSMRDAPKPKDELPTKYANQATTTLSADVQAGVDNENFVFDLQD